MKMSNKVLDLKMLQLWEFSTWQVIFLLCIAIITVFHMYDCTSKETLLRNEN